MIRGQELRSFYRIEALHPYFNEIGLGTTFTLEKAIQWWNQKDKNNNYINRRNTTPDWKSPLDAPQDKSNLLKLLGLDTTPRLSFKWTGWSPVEFIPELSQYQDQYQDAIFKEFSLNEWSITYKDIRSAQSPKPSYFLELKDIDASFNELDPINGLKKEGDLYKPTTLQIDDISLFHNLPIYNLIQLNRYVSELDDFIPFSLWNLEDDSSIFSPQKFWHSSQDNIRPLSSWFLINSIKTAKSGPCIEWNKDITFYTNYNGLKKDPCAITENITFRLYLYDRSSVSFGKDTSIVAFKDIFLSSPKNSLIGPAIGPDGTKEDVLQNITGSLNVVWDAEKNNWSAGTHNMLAIMAEDLATAQNPGIKQIEESNLEIELNDENLASSRFKPARAKAYPIHPQNRSSWQWSPVYKSTKSFRCQSINDVEKEKIEVFNLNPKKSFKKGEYVMLFNFGNAWVVSSLGQDDAEEEQNKPVDASIGKYGPFTYLIANSETFFTKNKLQDVDPHNAEVKLHKIFYQNLDDQDNQNKTYSLNGTTYFDTTPAMNLLPVGDHAYLQVSSFDYLDKQIGGLKDACSIASTIGNKDAAGRIIPFDKNKRFWRNNAICGVFFGCVFPDGYENVGKYNNGTKFSANYINSINGTSLNINGDKFFTGSDNETLSIFENNPLRNSCRNPSQLGTFGGEFSIDDFGSNLRWARNKDEPNATIFNDTTSQSNIPADVMLNSSPSGTYGSPLKSVHCLKDLYNETENKSLLSILLYHNNAYWLETVVSTQPTQTQQPGSLFDFRPKNPGSLMFRPLKMEAFLQYAAISLGLKATDLAVGSSQDTILVKSDKSYFYIESALTQLDNDYPVHTGSYGREAPFLNAFYDSRIGLKWGGYLQKRHSYRRLHRYGYWDRQGYGIKGLGSMNWTLNDDEWEKPLQASQASNVGANVFGIIATNVKVKANSSIVFDTNNLYGMGAGEGFRQAFSNLPPEQDETWGADVNANTYKLPNTMDLSVKIFQGWPSDQTIYDPRFFAVHHFNPGMNFVNDQFKGTGEIPTNINNVQSFINISKYPAIRNYKEKEFIDKENKFIYYYPESSGVDIKTPSIFIHPDGMHESGEYYLPMALDQGCYITSDNTLSEKLNPGRFSLYNGYPSYISILNSNLKRFGKLLPEEYWETLTDRTGRLLPYNYNMYTIGINADRGEEVLWVSSTNGRLTYSMIEDRQSLFIKNKGKNFNIGDRIGNTKYGVEIEVTETGVNGSALAFKCLSPGSGIPANLFKRWDERIYDTTTGGISLEKLTGNGQDFSCICPAGKVYIISSTDHKPQLITPSITRISSAKVKPTIITPAESADAEANSFVYEDRTVTIPIPEDKKSIDGTYDIFYHYHNDISFCWLASDGGDRKTLHGDEKNFSECHEQYIQVNLSVQ